MAKKQNLTILQGKTFKDILRWETEPIVRKAIAGFDVSTGCPRLTVTGHGLPNGWRVAVYNVGQPKEINAANNPPCVNPQHLRPGTRSDNMRDMVAKGRHRYPLGDEHHRVKLTDEQVVAIRENYTGQRGEISRTAEAYGVRANQIAKILHGQARAAAGGKIHEPKWRRGGWPR
jgi:hypothetical protein